MEECDLTGADLTDCNLTGTKMRGADLHQATYNKEDDINTILLRYNFDMTTNNDYQ